MVSHCILGAFYNFCYGVDSGSLLNAEMGPVEVPIGLSFGVIIAVSWILMPHLLFISKYPYKVYTKLQFLLDCLFSFLNQILESKMCHLEYIQNEKTIAFNIAYFIQKEGTWDFIP